MNSRDHGLLSVALAVAIVGLAPPPRGAVPLELAAIPFDVGAGPIDLGAVPVAIGVVVLGVAIDLDHFVLARLQTGSWSHARRVLADPRLALLDQDEIFEPGDVWREDRLLSHLLVGGVLAAGFWVLGAAYFAIVAALTVYVHVLADVYHDLRTREAYLQEGSRVVEGGQN